MITPLPIAPRRGMTREEQACHDQQHLFIISGVTLKWLKTCTTAFQYEKPKRRRPALCQRAKGHAAPVLTADQVRQIKCELRQGIERRVLAHRYGVHPATIYDIAMGRTWKGVK